MILGWPKSSSGLDLWNKTPRTTLNYEPCWLWCVTVGSSVLINVPLWQGMLIMGEVIQFGSRGYMRNLCSVQFSSVAQSYPTFCDPMNRNMPVHHQLPKFTQTHVHRVSDDIQPSHPLSSPSPPAPNPSQHHSLFQWVNPLHEVAKVLEFQL